MEPRKRKEIEHYDSHAREWLIHHPDDAGQGDFEGLDLTLLKSFQFCFSLLEKEVKGKRVLDYGCGNGVHLPLLARYAREVIAIDLSQPSLDIAAQRLKKEGLDTTVSLINMDCEHLAFPDNSFDVIFDSGTFSSIDLDRALPELARVLKSDGCLIGIETLGHNPLANLKRMLNKKTGKRTEWASSHIFKLSDLPRVRTYFDATDIWFFHPFSFILFPLTRTSLGRALFRIGELVDTFVLWIPGGKLLSFKVVFRISLPKK